MFNWSRFLLNKNYEKILKNKLQFLPTVDANKYGVKSSDLIFYKNSELCK